MKYLKKFNESKKVKISLDEFISELREELKNIGFKIEILEEIYIEINDEEGGTYIDFDLEMGFSLKELIDKCNDTLDNVRSYPCSEEVKDNYELLCMTILTFIDEKNYGKISKSSIKRYLKSKGRRIWKY